MRRFPPPDSVTLPPPSMTMSGPVVLRILAVAVSVIVTGAGPQSKAMTPPAATALTTAADVQLAAVPVPTTWSGCELSAARAAAGMPPSLPVPAGTPGVGGAGGAGGAGGSLCAVGPGAADPPGATVVAGAAGTVVVVSTAFMATV